MRILLVTCDYPPPFGGIQTFTVTLERELRNSRHDVRLLNFDSRNTNNYSNLRPRDILPTAATHNAYFSPRILMNPSRILSLDGGLRDYVFNNMMYRTVMEEVNHFQPDLIHLTSGRICLAVYGIHVPVVITLHSEEIRDTVPVRIGLNQATAIHCVSRFAQKKIAVLDRSVLTKTTVIPNAINIDAYDPSNSKSKKFQIISISRLDKQKNIEAIIRSIPNLPIQILHNGFQYICVGDGEERTKLESLVNSLGVSQYVTLSGRVSEDEKLRLMSDSSAFVLLPTKHQNMEEGFGIVFLEAQAAGLPIICSRVGGIEESVGDAGIYINDESDSKLIASAIDQVLTNHGLRKQLTNNGRKRIKSFSLKTWYQEVIKLYEKII